MITSLSLAYCMLFSNTLGVFGEWWRYCDFKPLVSAGMALVCLCVPTVCVIVVGLSSIRSALLSPSEWAQRAASGLQRRPRQNGAGVASQRNHTGDHHKGKVSCRGRNTPAGVRAVVVVVVCTTVYVLNKEKIPHRKKRIWCASPVQE